MPEPLWVPASANITPREADNAQALRAEVELLREDLGDALSEVAGSQASGRLDLALEDAGWIRLEAEAQQTLSRAGIVRAADRARIAYRLFPIIRRAINVRTYYTWAQGVTVEARDEQVGQVVTALLDDPGNQQAVFGHEARERLDRSVALDGNLYFALSTHEASGTVAVRTVDMREVVDDVRDPDDRARILYWRRSYRDTSGRRHDVLHPDVDHQPQGRPQHVTVGRDTLPVRWQQPLLHVAPDRLDGETWGVPEAFTALQWARTEKELLEDVASYVQAAAKIAWEAKRPTAKAAARAANTIDQAAGRDSYGRRAPAGQTAATAGDGQLRPLNHGGMTVDAVTVARPFALKVAQAFDVPYTILTGDADNSNRATAQTLDRPFELALTSRQKMWASVYRRICRHAVDAAVRAPQGSLPGTVERDVFGRTVVTLPDSIDPGVDVSWPELVEHSLADVLGAIKSAADTGALPPELVLRLAAEPLGVDDPDRWVDELKQRIAAAPTQQAAEEAAVAALEPALAEAIGRIADQHDTTTTVAP